MRTRPGARELVLSLAAFAAQAAITAPLFAGPLTRWRGSIESAFITDARFIAERFPHLSWNPLWYLGFPFELFYTPLLQVVVAALAPATGGAPSAYRIVAAIGYALGPAALYVLSRALGLRRAAALLAAAIFAVGPSIALVLPGLYDDARAFTGSSVPAPWRLVALVEYGEGPHVTGLSLLLFAAAALQWYLASGRRAAYWIAVALLVAVALTNLIALLGGAIFAAGVTFAVPAKRVRLERALRVGAMAGLLALTWYSPGFIRAIAGFSTPGGEGGGSGFLAFPIIVAAIAFGVRQARLAPAVAVGAFVALACIAILAAWYVARLPLAPQPIRYALELDAAFAILVAAGASSLARRATASSRRQTLAVAAAVALVLLVSTPGWVAAREAIAPDPNADAWSEREVALWLRDHLGPGERAYLSGSHSFWVDVFADVPQIRGGVDFAGTDPWWAHAAYQINTGSDADTSILWLRAFGVRYAVVSGPESKDIYRDFAKPQMFEGKLTVATTLQGTPLYRVEDIHATAALANADEMPASPRDALDRAALEAYLGWIAKTPNGTSANVMQRDLEQWQGEVSAPAVTLDVALPLAYDDGWHAYLEDLDHPHYESLPATVHPDPVGLLAVRVPAGHFALHVEHRLHRDHLLSLAIVCFALGGLGLWWSARRARVLPIAAPAAVAASTVLYALALGVVGGFPKGTDALMNLTRLRFVSDWFPDHNWLYAWSAGMPTFTTYPALPYLTALPFVRVFGPEATLDGLAFVALSAIGLGVYAHLRERGLSLVTALIAALAATTSLATWQWIVQAGAYARVFALGLGALSWWAHARALRVGGARWWIATIALVAASIASHPILGGLGAVYLAASHLALRGRRGVPRLALVAGLAALLAAPALVPSLASGVGGRFLGFDRADLAPLDAVRLVRPEWVGLVAFVLPFGLVLIRLTAAPLRAFGALALLAVPALYGLAPAIGLPSTLYYIRGVDPASMPFVAALAGALAFGIIAPRPGERGARLVAIAAAILLTANAAIGVPAYVAPPADPAIVDSSSRYSPEELARATVLVEPDDYSHRVMPLTADEAVGFSYRYRTPMLRDYYDQGEVHPDWTAWAFTSMYDPPLDAEEARAVAEWFAVDRITVPKAETARAQALAALPWLTPIATVASPYREFAVTRPSTIVSAVTAPLTVVVADDRGYDRMLRLLMADGAWPRTRLVVHARTTLADLPSDLATAAAAVLIVGDDLGDPARAANVLRALGSRGSVSVVWDTADTPTGAIAEPWPVTALAEHDIAAWTVTDRPGRIAGADFSPARYGDGPWRATVPQGLREGAIAELTLGGAPLIASRAVGNATVTVVGGNLFYHALINTNGREAAYLTSFLGAPASDAEREPDWSFVNPDVRVIRADGAPLVVRESFHPNWRATLQLPDGSTRELPIREAGPGVMALIPQASGTVRLEYGVSGPELFSWLLFLIGLGGLVAIARRRTS